MDLPTIPLLSHVQPLAAAYGTNNVTNNTTELLARIIACEILPINTLAIIVYDSVVVHSQHLALLALMHTSIDSVRGQIFEQLVGCLHIVLNKLTHGYYTERHRRPVHFHITMTTHLHSLTLY